MLRRARVLRPSLRGRRWVRALEVATPLARVGRFLRVWSPVEDVTLATGGPRMGKSGELACRILDHPGAVIAASTRTDLLRVCGPVVERGVSVSLCNRTGVSLAVLVGSALVWAGTDLWAAVVVAVVLVVPLSVLCGPRRREGRPVYVFNPSGVAGLASTVAFDPVLGCEHPTTAGYRAADLLAGSPLGQNSPGGDREFWIEQARRVLAVLLHAAALGGGSARDVLRWVAAPKAARGEVTRLLHKSPVAAFADDAEQFLTTNEKTQSSITTTIMPALAWLTDPTAVAATQACSDGSRVALDLATLLELRGVVFMIGGEDAAHVVPLVTAFTGHLAREARRLAALSPGGRLDPPCKFALDEVGLICPIPLPRWTADFGGAGCPLDIRVQGLPQLRMRWGKDGAATILNNANTLMVFGGTREPEDLQTFATLSGEREDIVPTWDAHGRVTSTTVRHVPVLSAAQLSQLPDGHVMIVKQKMAPVIGRLRMAWRRSDVRHVQRAIRWETRLAAFETWAEPRFGELSQRVAVLVERRRARRRVVAAQRRARKRGL